MSVPVWRAFGPFSLGAAALGGGAASAFLVTVVPPAHVLAVVGGLVLLVALSAKPWAGVPVVVIGGVLGDKAFQLQNVTDVSSLRTALLVLAVGAVALRRLQRDDWGARVRTPADGAAIAFAAYAVALAVWGVALGNDRHEALVAGYQLLVLPAYFFLATFTLNTRERAWAAAWLFCAGAAVLALMAYGEGGRQGGLFSAIALLGVLALASRRDAGSGERLVLSVLAPLFLVDLALSGYRTLWLAAGAAAVLLALSLVRARRPLLMAGAVALVAAGTAASVAGGTFAERVDTARAQVEEPGGYRSAETDAGRSMVADAPLVGRGLGRVDRDRYLESLGYTDVGPVFHAFYLTVAVNAGLVGLLLLAWFLLTAARSPRRSARRSDGARLPTPPWDREAVLATAMRALLGGTVLAAAFAGPTDGHWELGLLPALALLLDGFTTHETSAPAAAAAVPLPTPAALVAAPALTMSAIVVSYRSARELEHCLPPLLEAGIETVVVDNASDDDSVAVVREGFPTVKLIESATNDGFAAANNRALEHVSGNIVLLVNPDCRLDPASARALGDYLTSHPEVGIVGPGIEDESGRHLASAHRFETAGSVAFQLAGGQTLVPPAGKRALARLVGGGDSYEANYGSAPRPVDWVSGACLAVRAELLRRLGGLDDGYFMYMEDEDLCRRTWDAGSKVVYLPTARARHTGGASSGDRTHVWPEFYRSMLRFQARTQPRSYPLVRSAVTARAAVGMALGTTRDAARALRGRPPEHRARAWRRIFRLAAAADPERARTPWRDQVADDKWRS